MGAESNNELNGFGTLTAGEQAHKKQCISPEMSFDTLRKLPAEEQEQTKASATPQIRFKPEFP